MTKPVMRQQVSTYLSSEEDFADWAKVKAHYENQENAVVLRQLIREKALDIASGSTKRQSIKRIEDRLEFHDRLLMAIVEKLEIEVVKFGEGK